LADGEAEAVQEVKKNLPVWPDWLPNKLINLGLDLRGGAQVSGSDLRRFIFRKYYWLLGRYKEDFKVTEGKYWFF